MKLFLITLESHLLGCFLAGVPVIQYSFQPAEPCSPCPTKSLLSLDLSQTSASGLQECHPADTVERHDGIAGCSWRGRAGCGHQVRE